MSFSFHVNNAAWPWNPPHLQPYADDAFAQPEDVQCSTECTGLMQVVPDCQTAADAISGLYAIHSVKPQENADGVAPRRPI